MNLWIESNVLVKTHYEYSDTFKESYHDQCGPTNTFPTAKIRLYTI